MPDTLTIFHKQIDLIQDCIKRMANNSFLIKAWTVGLLTIILIIAEKFNVSGLLIAFIPILAFWYLDSVFLHTEKMYRKMYEELIKSAISKDIDFRFYDLNPKRFKEQVDTRIKVILSHTMIVFYLSLLIVALLIFVVSYFNTQHVPPKINKSAIAVVSICSTQIK